MVSVELSDWVALLALILSFASLAFTYGEIRKSGRVLFLTDILALYNRDDFLKARRKILSDYLKNHNDIIYSQLDVDRDQLSDIEHVAATYNRLGIIFESKMVDKTLLLKMFSGNIVRIWPVLKEQIVEARKYRNEEDYMIYCEEFYNHAVKYRKDKGYPDLQYFRILDEKTCA